MVREFCSVSIYVKFSEYGDFGRESVDYSLVF